MLKRDEIVELLIDIFDRIEVQTPSNFEEIVDYISTKKNYNKESVAFNFKLWVDEKDNWGELMVKVEDCLNKHNNIIDGRDIIDTPYSGIIEGLKNVSYKETNNAVIEFNEWYNNL